MEKVYQAQIIHIYHNDQVSSQSNALYCLPGLATTATTVTVDVTNKPHTFASDFACPRPYVLLSPPPPYTSASKVGSDDGDMGYGVEIAWLYDRGYIKVTTSTTPATALPPLLPLLPLSLEGNEQQQHHHYHYYRYHYRSCHH